MGYSATVSLEVWENVKKYFAEHLKQYQLVDVMRASKHPDDHYLYMVIARKRDKKAMDLGHVGLVGMKLLRV